MKSKQVNPFPQINLKGENIFHQFDNDQEFELVIEYKRGGLPRDFINPIDTVEIIDGMLAVTNRISDYRYKYKIKDIKSAFLVPIGVKN